MSLAHSRVRAHRSPPDMIAMRPAGAWGARPTVAVGTDPASRRFFRRSSLALVAGGAIGGALAMSGALVTGTIVGVGALIAAPFVKG